MWQITHLENDKSTFLRQLNAQAYQKRSSAKATLDVSLRLHYNVSRSALLRLINID